VIKSSGSQASIALLPIVEITKGGKSGAVSGAGKEKATAEEKGKRSFHHTRVGMDFDPKTTLHNQREVDEYLANRALNSLLRLS